MGGILSCISLNLCECACCLACTCCQGIVSGTLAQMVRLGHLIILVSTFVLALVIGEIYNTRKLHKYSSLFHLKLGSDCYYEDDFCIQRQLIYRASASLFLLFSVLGGLSINFQYFDKGMWSLKIISAIGMLVGFCWMEDSVFNIFGEIARVLSVLWLLIQAVLLLDFAHDMHDLIIEKADNADNNNIIFNNRFWYILYILLSLSFFTAVILGFSQLFTGYTGCSINMFFVILTLILGVITTILSLLEIVNKGLLTPSIMFAYSVFMCWYSLLSNSNNNCNPYITNQTVMDTSMGIIIGISMIILLYCVAHGSTILNIFNPQGNGVMMESYTQDTPMGQPINSNLHVGLERDEHVPTSVAMDRTPFSPLSPLSTTTHSAVMRYSGTAHERVIFHIFMILASCYGAMILTHWISSDGSIVSELGRRVADESMWLKILSQWIFLALYLRALYVAYSENI